MCHPERVLARGPVPVFGTFCGCLALDKQQSTCNEHVQTVMKRVNLASGIHGYLTAQVSKELDVLIYHLGNSVLFNPVYEVTVGVKNSVIASLIRNFTRK